jgi:hypothetical protein
MPMTAFPARATLLTALLALNPAMNRLEAQVKAPAQSLTPALAIQPNNRFTFTPESFAFPGAEFDLVCGPGTDVTWSGAAAAWNINDNGSLTLAVPPKPGAEAVVVTVNGNWAGTSGQFFVDVAQDAVSDSVMHRNFGDAFQFNHALVLRGSGKVKVRIRPDGQRGAPFKIQSIVVFFLKGA